MLQASLVETQVVVNPEFIVVAKPAHEPTIDELLAQVAATQARVAELRARVDDLQDYIEAVTRGE